MPSPINLTQRLSHGRPVLPRRRAKTRFPEPLKKKAERRLTLDVFSGIVYVLFALAVIAQVALIAVFY